MATVVVLFFLFSFSRVKKKLKLPRYIEYLQPSSAYSLYTFAIKMGLKLWLYIY